MKTADRILADGLVPPFSLGKHRSLGEDWKVSAAQVKTDLASCPVIVADNVAAYTRASRTNYVLEEFPCLAPPWPVFWMEYPSVSGKQRRGVLVRDVTDTINATKDDAFGGSIKDARANGFEGEPKWVIELCVVAEDERHNICGPVGWLVLALDDHGMVVGNRWVLGTPMGPKVRPEFQLYNGQTFDDTWLIAALLPAFQSISFLHCKNMVVDRIEPPAKLSAKHRRRHGRPLLRYQQVRLEVPRAPTRRRGEGSGSELGPPALHIVAGHMAHYGDCHVPRPGCPQEHGYDRCMGCGGHTPHGKLFGKHEGMYWVPQMSRGNPTRGEVKTDLELVVKP